MELTAALPLLSDAIHKTWNEVCGDVYDMEGDVDNITAMAYCLDADRVMFAGGNDTANRLLLLLCREHTYPKVLKFLSKNIRLA
jgi:hypothetical protein